jgi:prepilin-type N-terminal cleavage/methylation domain-containing protein/prepilin-type processing-associated H-X9-DG protein
MRIRATIQRVTQTTGFTLVELLVVVVLFALLLSLMMPALQDSFATGKTAGCMAKLQAMGAGIHLYGADRNCYPHTHYFIGVEKIPWPIQLYPYMFNEQPPTAWSEARKHFTCPAADQGSRGNRASLLSYQANVRVLPEGGPPLPLASVPSPASTMIIADARQSQWTYHYANRHDLASPADILNATNALNNSGGIQPHLKKNNWLFADGHVATLNVEDTCRQPRNNNNPRKYWSIDPND